MGNSFLLPSQWLTPSCFLLFSSKCQALSCFRALTSLLAFLSFFFFWSIFIPRGHQRLPEVIAGFVQHPRFYTRLPSSQRLRGEQWLFTRKALSMSTININAIHIQESQKSQSSGSKFWFLHSLARIFWVSHLIPHTELFSLKLE